MSDPTTPQIRRQTSVPHAVTRFAPSPTGYLHLGHAMSALIAAEAAQRTGGRFLLRIEDIDTQRCRPHYKAALLEDLGWLFQGMPVISRQFLQQPARQQSDHFDRYRQALDALMSLGVVYPCFCSRAVIEAEIRRAGGAPHGVEGPLYPGTCRALSPAEGQDRIAANVPHVWRLDSQKALAMVGEARWHDVERGAQMATMDAVGDVVLWRRDTPSSYHLSVVVDDGLQGISLITRGEDLRAVTGLHRYLQALLALPTPDYLHHPLLRGADGRRLAKRDKGLTLRQLIKDGHSPAAVRQMVAADVDRALAAFL